MRINIHLFIAFELRHKMLKKKVFYEKKENLS